MKWLALLLVLANVAFFGWRYEMRLRHAEQAALPAAPLPAHLPSLTLITELDELPPLRESAHAESANALPAMPAGVTAAEGTAAEAAPAGESVGTTPAPTEAATAVAGASSAAAGPEAAAATEAPMPNAPAIPEALPTVEAEAGEAAADAADPNAAVAGGSTAPTAAETPDAQPAAATGETPATTAATPPAAAEAAEPRASLLTDSPEPPVVAPRDATATGVPTDVCINVGPFPDARHADAVQAWLAPRATSLYRVTQVMRRRQFFWVYLEPKNAEEAAARVADLERKGVHDYLVIQRSDLQKAISLGLFSTQDAVNRRLSEMNKQGFNPVVVPRIEVTDYDWLRANLAVGFTDTSALPRDALAGAAVQPLDCARIAEPDPSP